MGIEVKALRLATYADAEELMRRTARYLGCGEGPRADRVKFAFVVAVRAALREAMEALLMWDGELPPPGQRDSAELINTGELMHARRTVRVLKQQLDELLPAAGEG